MKLPMFNDSAGNPSFTLTAAALTLGVVLVKYLVAGVTIGTVSLGPSPDSTLTIGMLTVLWTGYVARRNEILTPAAAAAKASGKVTASAEGDPM